MELYPLKFEPICHYRIWGGENLKNVLKKPCKGHSIGESWEISAVPENETIVSAGTLKGKTINQLSKRFKEAFLGNKVYNTTGTEFPLLIKFIDSSSPLSIQVHPNDLLAKERHNSLGKNEMWYIMPSSQKATITVGFKDEVNEQSYLKHIENNSITEVLNTLEVKEGDAFYIPSGRIHAIGAGVLLAEIQQSSDVTYRIYDYDRVDQTTGEKRQLHTELALEAIDFKRKSHYQTDYKKSVNKANKLVSTPFFKTNFLSINQDIMRDLQPIDSFVIYMCVKGSATIAYNDLDYGFKMGETLFIPAAIEQITLKTNDHAELIEVFM
jgi:mannose-6-phosphate isomerase